MVQRGDPPACYYFIYTSFYKNYAHKMASSITQRSLTITVTDKRILQSAAAMWRTHHIGTMASMLMVKAINKPKYWKSLGRFLHSGLDHLGQRRFNLKLGGRFKQPTVLKYSCEAQTSVICRGLFEICLAVIHFKLTPFFLTVVLVKDPDFALILLTSTTKTKTSFLLNT